MQNKMKGKKKEFEEKLKLKQVTTIDNNLDNPVSVFSF